jgi:hypothetical protein
VPLLLIAGVLLALAIAKASQQRGSASATGSSGVFGSDTSDTGPFGGDGSALEDYSTRDELVTGWATIEGYFKPGTLAQRLNNPVNIHGNWPGVTGHTASGEAIFDTPEDGFSAADAWVQKQEQQHPTWSFRQLFAKVLGALDGTPVNNAQGNSDAEANFVAGYVGTSPDTIVTDFLEGAS